MRQFPAHERRGPRRAGWRGFFGAAVWAAGAWAAEPGPLEISGRYPHLAMFNQQGECGVGAVVPWADRLWVITYAPHKPGGSDDQLYEITPDLQRKARLESVGGTPAGRLIHRESDQLLIGPYLINSSRMIRVLKPDLIPGRLTAIARHLTDPANKVYIYDMEGALYEVNVRNLDVRRLFNKPAPGAHGKGAYTAQGRLVVANNGEAGGAQTLPRDVPPPEEAGALAEWDGRTWKVVTRRPFTEVTGPGGITGAPAAAAPAWSLGWDRRSVLLALLDGGRWYRFRLPKADYSYDGRHGWHTEWPRIREVEPGRFLMNMHGGWFDFPGAFAVGKTGGLRPIASHLKITGDFCGWNGRIVFGCDDLARDAFGGGNPVVAGLQSQSNLWFARREDLAACGRSAGFGGPWVNDTVTANTPSDPYLLAGYRRRVLHLSHEGSQMVTFTLEVDERGDGTWTPFHEVAVMPGGYAWYLVPDNVEAQWIRLKTDRLVRGVTAYFIYDAGGGAVEQREQFAALADASASGPWTYGRIMAQGGDTGVLRYDALPFDEQGRRGEVQSFHIGPDLKFQRLTGAAARDTTTVTGQKVDVVIRSEPGSVLLIQGAARYRLPRTDPAYDRPGAPPPDVREVVTERSLLNAHGTFYVLPRPSAGGAARLKPVCTHRKFIADFCSWRGLLVLSGTRAATPADGKHFFTAGPGAPGLWFGDVDDLWKMGKPHGRGSPWLRTAVQPGEASDPYLMAGYDRKTVELSHDLDETVTFTLEVDVLGDGTWREFHAVEVPGRRGTTYTFPEGYSAHWVRLRANRPCVANALFTYE